ncbi:alpha-amylase family protein [Geminisphaera colitermitum]|uniref:alpha-amylase family protein n=1 Tax=Geminisphaera colitermitum TaxID=1148786 RepID=UPI0001965450|nr:alpha-amylase family protein [Geminisphaera colitermitum]
MNYRALVSCSFAVLSLLSSVAMTITARADVQLVKHFADESLWRLPPSSVPGIAVEKTDGAMRLILSGTGDAAARRKFELKLKNWVTLPKETVRAGLWVYVKKRPALDDAWLTFVDAKGREFEYTLPRLESWQPGWQFLETFAFDANEMGKLHPQVGRLVDRTDEGGGMLPVRPLQLTGIRFEAKGDAHGEWVLGHIVADEYTLGKGGYHWALNVPGLRYNMTQTWTQSGVAPYLLADQLLPGGGDAIVSWEVLKGFQGAPVLRGEQRLTFDAHDFWKKFERVAKLGDLSPGNYEVIVTRRSIDLGQATPDGWNRLIWRATGEARWEGRAMPEACILRGEKTGGEEQGSAGWRQMVKVPGAGRYELSVTGGGSGRPVVRAAPMDERLNVVGAVEEEVFVSGNKSHRISRVFDWPEGVARIQLDLMATREGDAAFSAISLKRLADGAEMIVNGNAQVAGVLHQERWALSVLSAPSSVMRDNRSSGASTVSSTKIGDTLIIPAPSWAKLPGEKTWRVVADASGEIVGSGVMDANNPIRWAPPAGGIFRYTAERLVDGTPVDRDSRTLGGHTPLSPPGSDSFDYRDKAPTEAELFGPGKNYFTWAMYENHPDDPRFFSDTCQWIKDGRKAGFDLFRIRADWNKIERLPGVYDFVMLDRIINEVERQGGRVVLELRYEAPVWLPVEHQLNNYGRADVWQRCRVGRIPSVWTPGMLDSIRTYTEVAVRHYRNRPAIVGYHVWGLPGSLDWTTIDKPYWGQRADYSPTTVAAFNQWSKGRYAERLPMASQDWSRPDLSDGWRDWVEFRRHGLETFFIDYVLKPIRGLDDRRSIVGYFGLDFASPRLSESARSLRWRRHTGGCELYYQVPLEAKRAVTETGMAWPHEVHLLTPVPAGLEQATFQISGSGGEGYHWNFYWRNNIPVGTWTPNREAGLAEWVELWSPLWKELRDSELARQPDMAAVHTWSTMQFGLRSFFPLRMGDYVTRPAAAMYRDKLAPAWFSENGTMQDLDRYKLLVVPPVGAQVMPRRMADALAGYVDAGGRIVVFPDSGRWVIEEPTNDDALWKRLGWQAAGVTTAGGKDGQTSDVGNSGLPRNDNEDAFAGAVPVRGSRLFAEGQRLWIRKSPSVKLGKTGAHEVEARFTDGSPAVISWQRGKGRVVAFSGQPDWPRVTGLMRGFYSWAGGILSSDTSRPDVEITHLKKGDVHYAIVHRLPDSFRPHLPMPIPDLDREALHKMMAQINVVWQLNGLPQGHWRVSELTGLEQIDGARQSADSMRGIKSTGEISRGLTARMFLSQTLVYKLEPAHPDETP